MWQSVEGYVIIQIEGAGVERLLNRLQAAGIPGARCGALRQGRLPLPPAAARFSPAARAVRRLPLPRSHPAAGRAAHPHGAADAPARAAVRPAARCGRHRVFLHAHLHHPRGRLRARGGAHRAALARLAGRVRRAAAQRPFAAGACRAAHGVGRAHRLGRAFARRGGAHGRDRRDEDRAPRPSIPKRPATWSPSRTA